MLIFHGELLVYQRVTISFSHKNPNQIISNPNQIPTVRVPNPVRQAHSLAMLDQSLTSQRVGLFCRMGHHIGLSVSIVECTVIGWWF